MQWSAQVARRARHARLSATVAIAMRATRRDTAQYCSNFISYVGGGELCSLTSSANCGSSVCSVAALSLPAVSSVAAPFLGFTRAMRNNAPSCECEKSLVFWVFEPRVCEKSVATGNPDRQAIGLGKSRQV